MIFNFWLIFNLLEVRNRVLGEQRKLENIWRTFFKWNELFITDLKKMEVFRGIMERYLEKSANLHFLKVYQHLGKFKMATYPLRGFMTLFRIPSKDSNEYFLRKNLNVFRKNTTDKTI